MAGLDLNTPVPTEIRLHRQSRQLEIRYDDGQCFLLDAEYLRVHSPSAEVRGHSPEQARLQTGKRNVNLTGVQPVGHYAVKLVFDDGHDSGLYSWDYLYQLGAARETNWQDYLARLATAGASRD